jgi:hypothetical protein
VQKLVKIPFTMLLANFDLCRKVFFPHFTANSLAMSWKTQNLVEILNCDRPQNFNPFTC